MSDTADELTRRLPTLSVSTKHTPGPWVAGESRYGHHVAMPVGNWTSAVKCEADARLIAAAPELLAALQAFCAWAEAHRDEKGSPARSGPYRAARAAIAKAVQS